MLEFMISDMVMLSIQPVLLLLVVSLKQDYCVIAFVLSHLFSLVKEKRLRILTSQLLALL